MTHVHFAKMSPLSLPRTATAASLAAADGNNARRDFLNYALSLMRAHNNEHSDLLPMLDITALKHVGSSDS